MESILISEPSGFNPATAAYPPKKANDEPRNAGTFLPVIKWNNKVPKPAINNVVATSNPVRSGTNTVAAKHSESML